MKVTALILLVAAIIFIVSLDVILEALPWPVLKFLGIIAAAFLSVLAVVAVMSAMFSSKLSREEEAAAADDREQ